VLTPQEKSGVVSAGAAAALWTIAVVLVAVAGGSADVVTGILVLVAVVASLQAAWTLRTAARTLAIRRTALAALVLWAGFVLLSITQVGPSWTVAAVGGAASVALAATTVTTLLARHRRQS
jgi:F0F1-type ATP synthase assembly protein I